MHVQWLGLGALSDPPENHVLKNPVRKVEGHSSLSYHYLFHPLPGPFLMRWAGDGGGGRRAVMRHKRSRVGVKRARRMPRKPWFDQKIMLDTRGGCLFLWIYTQGEKWSWVRWWRRRNSPWRWTVIVSFSFMSWWCWQYSGKGGQRNYKDYIASIHPRNLRQVARDGDFGGVIPHQLPLPPPSFSIRPCPPAFPPCHRCLPSPRAVPGLHNCCYPLPTLGRVPLECHARHVRRCVQCLLRAHVRRAAMRVSWGSTGWGRASAAKSRPWEPSASF